MSTICNHENTKVGVAIHQKYVQPSTGKPPTGPGQTVWLRGMHGLMTVRKCVDCGHSVGKNHPT